ncbi:NYN domain-containing protein [Sphingopyxis sp. RIFCSPHIGHO2_12_FULL_65_19]|uniref:NYN domain-containing protein n=1 Tax=Sphingopyxis sp. RIFCSPHIGHO2_12_FULL_65_19 TaxID=1802172 RepID=UPI0008B477B1|nr:NYN domain-containing protein [Sphingopyxis sp. RIFCSPHIGHO2_12_FULL_65_19]OHD05258.1 MAG: Maebl [Sphingopyxis sp. RIFCSPHIGHO2_12_FULL_65_19]
MTTATEPLAKLAVLIDAENMSPKIVSGLFKEIATIGEASVRRIYGDFSGTRLKGWAEVLAAHAIMPHQNFANVGGKNASDIALVIDAMDLMHSGRFEGFCLVSSDSDFTRLAARIREQGIAVYGFGEQKTPQSFRHACKRFVFTENLSVSDGKASSNGAGASLPAATLKLPPTDAVPLIKAALSQLEELDGWYPLGAVGTRLVAEMPDFDPRSYGFPKLSQLVDKSAAFDVRRDNLLVHIRPK